ncbi:unnamed protein product [Cyprideis torosa]|uniref:Uncharacterized protein n=1 Tax=Cyprideis torosa TaxID=163714 RepID=A0A7R8ZPY8_9CRUS|nr:unnamed protein product [Cyprideis torosa]CAG0890920.1 unnamed protein product [Cyprideis torosa]
MKRSTLTTQVSQVELLRAEIEMLTSRRSDLERRVQSLSHEREDLSMTLDESSDRILHLEREGREKEVLVDDLMLLSGTRGGDKHPYGWGAGNVSKKDLVSLGQIPLASLVATGFTCGYRKRFSTGLTCGHWFHLWELVSLVGTGFTCG